VVSPRLEFYLGKENFVLLCIVGTQHVDRAVARELFLNGRAKPGTPN